MLTFYDFIQVGGSSKKRQPTHRSSSVPATFRFVAKITHVLFSLTERVHRHPKSTGGATVAVTATLVSCAFNGSLPPAFAAPATVDSPRAAYRTEVRDLGNGRWAPPLSV